MIKVLISAFLNVFLIAQVNAFQVDGRKVQLGKQDLILLNQNTCNAYGGIEKYVAWGLPAPDSYISSRVYCNLIRAQDGYLRRNVFDCNNQEGRWDCDLIATELKYNLPEPIDYIFLSSTQLLDAESIEIVDKLVSNVSDKSMYHEASCNVEKSAKNKDLFIVQCNYRNYLEILRSCDNTVCTWSIINSGNIFN